LHIFEQLGKMLGLTNIPLEKGVVKRTKNPEIKNDVVGEELI
jgi:hypothetical protein